MYMQRGSKYPLLTAVHAHQYAQYCLFPGKTSDDSTLYEQYFWNQNGPATWMVHEGLTPFPQSQAEKVVRDGQW